MLIEYIPEAFLSCLVGLLFLLAVIWADHPAKWKRLITLALWGAFVIWRVF